MEFSSVLLGDLADLFQDHRIRDVKEGVAAVASTSRRNQVQLAGLAQVVELRCNQLQRDNAVLGLLVEKLLMVLAEQQPERAASIVAEVRNAVTAARAPDDIGPLRKALDLPVPAKSTGSVHTKPVFKRPSRQAPVSKDKPPGAAAP